MTEFDRGMECVNVLEEGCERRLLEVEGWRLKVEG